MLAVASLIPGCSNSDTNERAGADLPALFFSVGGALYVSDPAGGVPRKLTDGPGDTDPAPSPDGRRVAYVHRNDPAEPGGELRVLDVSTGDSRRLVDPGALVPKFDADQPQITAPRWSPTGDRVAFLKATYGGGGFLLTAAADSGEVSAPPEPLFADFGYAWSPDGRRIVWVGGRSDVSPVDVGEYMVGGVSRPVLRGVNATAVDYSPDGRSIVFANADATGSAFAAIPFELRGGGIYSVVPGERPVALLSGSDAVSDVSDVQALPGQAVGFAAWSGDQRTRNIAIAENGVCRDVGDTPGDAPAPVWAVESRGVIALAYVGNTADRPLLVTTDGAPPKKIGSGVEAFAWGAA